MRERGRDSERETVARRGVCCVTASALQLCVKGRFPQQKGVGSGLLRGTPGAPPLSNEDGFTGETTHKTVGPVCRCVCLDLEVFVCSRV